MFPTANGFAIILFGFLVIMFGASLFGDVWEILQAEQRYAAQEAGYFSSSLCKDHPTACLIKDDPHYSGQIVPGIVAEVVWYLGLAIAYYGFQESYWKDITESKTVDYIVSLR